MFPASPPLPPFPPSPPFSPGWPSPPAMPFAPLLEIPGSLHSPSGAFAGWMPSSPGFPGAPESPLAPTFPLLSQPVLHSGCGSNSDHPFHEAVCSPILGFGTARFLGSGSGPLVSMVITPPLSGTIFCSMENDGRTGLSPSFTFSSGPCFFRTSASVVPSTTTGFMGKKWTSKLPRMTGFFPSNTTYFATIIVWPETFTFSGKYKVSAMYAPWRGAVSCLAWCISGMESSALLSAGVHRSRRISSGSNGTCLSRSSWRPLEKFCRRCSNLSAAVGELFWRAEFTLGFWPRAGRETNKTAASKALPCIIGGRLPYAR